MLISTLFDIFVDMIRSIIQYNGKRYFCMHNLLKAGRNDWYSLEEIIPINVNKETNRIVVKYEYVWTMGSDKTLGIGIQIVHESVFMSSRVGRWEVVQEAKFVPGQEAV